MRRQAVEAGVLDKLDGLDGLTSRQQVFVSLCFSGLSDTEAYRQTYDCQEMAEKAIRANAHVLRHSPSITLKLRELQDARDKQSTLASSLTREWITNRIMGLATEGDKDSVKLAALVALGKVVGIDLFRETTRVERIERTPADIDRELEEHLRSMTKTIEAKANVIADKAPDRRRKPR